MIEPTIIDGVDVSGCEFAEESATTPKCQINGYIHCDGYNCRYKQLQRKIKQNDELTKIIQERNEEIKNLNYTLYEDRELTTDLVKANLKISKLERTLSSVTNKFKYDWQNKTAECEELHTELKFKVEYIQEQVEIINQSSKRLAPFEDECFKGLDTKQIAELAKKSIRLTTENRKLECVFDEIEKFMHYEFCGDNEWVRKAILDIISKAKGG